MNVLYDISIIGWGDIPENTDAQYFSCLLVLIGSTLVTGALVTFAEQVNRDRDNWYENQIQENNYYESIKKNKNNPITTTALFVGYHWHKVRIILLYLAFIIVGTVASWIEFDWPFSSALYFSLSSLSTAGLMPVPGDSKDETYFLVALFACIGVPITVSNEIMS